MIINFYLLCNCNLEEDICLFCKLCIFRLYFFAHLVSREPADDDILAYLGDHRRQYVLHFEIRVFYERLLQKARVFEELAKLALGYRLHELKNSVTKSTSAFFEPALEIHGSAVWPYHYCIRLLVFAHTCWHNCCRRGNFWLIRD